MADGIEIFANEYIQVHLEQEGKLLRVARTSLGFPDPETIERAYAPLMVILDKLGRTDRCLLSDMRLAPGRNDPAFEAAFARVRSRAVSGFRKTATLVSSKVGILQISRLIREDRVERLVTDSEAEALAYLGFGPRMGP